MDTATISFAANRDPVTKGKRIVGFGPRLHPTLDEPRFGLASVRFGAQDAKRLTSALAVRKFAAGKQPAVEVFEEDADADAGLRGSDPLFEQLRERMRELHLRLAVARGATAPLFDPVQRAIAGGRAPARPS